jgi:hypothetical protein
MEAISDISKLRQTVTGDITKFVRARFTTTTEPKPADSPAPKPGEEAGSSVPAPAKPPGGDGGDGKPAEV